MNIWDEIKSVISGKITTEAYQNWLSKTFFLRSEGTRLWVGVPDVVTKDWIQQEYNGEIWSAIRDRNFGIRQIVYELSGSSDETGRKNPADEKVEITVFTLHQFESEVYVRHFRGRLLQPVRACRRPSGGNQSVAEPTIRCSSTAAWAWGRRI